MAAKAGGKIGGNQRLSLLLGIVRQIDDRCFEPRKGEVELAFGMGGRQRVGVGIALMRDGIQRHTAGIGQADTAGGLIESFARGVIGGAAQDGVVAVIPHQYDMAVPAADDERQKRRFQLGMSQIICRHMATDMVNRDEGLFRRKCQALGEIDPHQHRTNESRRSSNGHGIHFAGGKACLLQRFGGHPTDGFDVAAGGGLRDDPAVELVFFHLRMDDRGTDLPAILNDRGGGLIAAGFDTENFHTGSGLVLFFMMTGNAAYQSADAPEQEQSGQEDDTGLFQLIQRKLIADENDLGVVAFGVLTGDDQAVFTAPVKVDGILFHSDTLLFIFTQLQSDCHQYSIFCGRGIVVFAAAHRYKIMFLVKSNGRGIGFPHLQRNGGKAKAFGPAQQLIEQSIGDALAAMCRKNRHISDAALIQYIFHAKVAKRFPFPLR